MHENEINNCQSQVQALNENDNAQDLTRSWAKRTIGHSCNQSRDYEITMEESINSHRQQVRASNENDNAQDAEEIDKLDMENRAVKIGIGRELMQNQHDRFKSRRHHSHAHIGRAGPEGARSPWSESMILESEGRPIMSRPARQSKY